MNIITSIINLDFNFFIVNEKLLYIEELKSKN